MPSPPGRRWRSSTAIQAGARRLRSTLTPAERRLWQHLRRGQLNAYEFRRQHPIGRFIVDFYCPKARLVIEVDGDTHADRLEYDLERTRWLEEQKVCRVIRFTNDEIHNNLPAVLEAIAAFLKRPPP